MISEPVCSSEPLAPRIGCCPTTSSAEKDLSNPGNAGDPANPFPNKNFTPADDQDWVTFDLSETSTILIRTTGDVDTYIKLFDRLGNMVAEDDDSGGDYNALIERLLQRGQYFLRIHQVEGDAVFGAEYSLILTSN